MRERVEVRLAGFGGQGIAKAGYVLGKAIALGDHNEAVFTQEYGPESRGGTSSAAVVASTRPIDEPFVEHPDVLVVLYQAAFEKYAKDIAASGQLLIDSDLVEPHDVPPTVEVLAIPCTRLAEELGDKIAVNSVMLGFLAAVTGDLVGDDSLCQAIRTSLPKRALELNLAAFKRGYDFGLELRRSGGGGEPSAG